MRPNQSIRRLVWLLWAIVIWTGAIVARLVTLQVVQHAQLRAIADSQHYINAPVAALRGSILDRTGQPLAKTLLADSVAVDPQAVPDLHIAADQLARVLGLDRRKLLLDMQAYKDKERRFMWVAHKLTPDESQRVRALKLEGIVFRQEMRRYYPRKTLAAHVLGSTGYSADSEIEHGTAGIERTFEDFIGGQPGQERLYTDSKRHAYDSVITQTPVPGGDIVLTIDPNVQYEAERQLKEAVLASGARSGSVVALDPYSGDVLAMANYPTYDPNFAEGRSREEPGARSNIAISTPFEPGSVFKVITLAAALESTNLTPESMFNCGNGLLNLFGRVIHDHDRYSSLSMADVLAHSSNIGAIQIALATGSEAFYAYQKRFGFGARTGIELPGESGGTLWPLERWGKSSIGSMAMGHEVAVTSVQLAVAGAAIANGGLKVKPRLVLSRQRPGQPKENLPAEKSERILKPETTIQMRQMMEGVVLHGTGSKAVLKGYTSGGKTGSAQIFDPAAHVYTHNYNASFLGFAPVGNPRIVIAVTLQGTHGGTTGFGGVRAAPIFREVATGALRILEVPKDLPGSEKRQITERPVESDLASVAGVDPERGFGAAIAAEHLNSTHSDAPSSKAAVPVGSDFARSTQPSGKAEGARSDVVSSVTLPLARGGSPVSAGSSVAGQRPFLKEPQIVTRGAGVPDFRGKTLRDVLQESMAAGVTVEPSGEGLAVSQDPAPGASLPPRSPVRVSFRR